jgi:hypothetical protein
MTSLSRTLQVSILATSLCAGLPVAGRAASFMPLGELHDADNVNNFYAVP